MSEASLELWAGAECSVVRIGDRYVDQLERTGHGRRPGDLELLASCGVRAVRQPLLWERTAPSRVGAADFGWADDRLERLRSLGLRPILGLVHHGSGPPGTSLLDESFADGLAAYAQVVAERYPWVRDFTPVNEPLTTARFSALYGHWYPHEASDRAFARAVFVQCRAIRAAMRAIREVVPDARLVQTEDVGTIFATPRMAYQARFENQRRFLTLDLLTGRLTRVHPLWSWLVCCGQVAENELDEFAADPCPPDVLGLNYYVTSDRFLDERVSRYPARTHGGNGRDEYADIEAVRVRSQGITGHRDMIELLVRRFGIPVAITEAHLGGPPEQRIRWLVEAWEAAVSAVDAGLPVCAVTAWSAFGSYDWDSLLLRESGHYEPGMFDVRGGIVRPTAVAAVARDLAEHGSSSHPLLAEDGWWAIPSRLAYPPVGFATSARDPRRSAPIVVTGAAGTLGRALVRVCRDRDISVVAMERAQLDVTDADAVARALTQVRPWAVVNAAGYVRVDDAERDCDRCFEANVGAVRVLADACADAGIRFATFSSDLVFDGSKAVPYVEDDLARPLGVYGRSKAAAEQIAIDRCPDALVARTSAFFGPWDDANFIWRVLSELRAGRRIRAASDSVVSPTYVPDLADGILTLLVDGASGLFHVACPAAISWYELARSAARLANLPDTNVLACAGAELGQTALRPAFSALASTRCALVRPLDEALAACIDALPDGELAQTG